MKNVRKKIVGAWIKKSRLYSKCPNMSKIVNYDSNQKAKKYIPTELKIKNITIKLIVLDSASTFHVTIKMIAE